MSKILIIHSTEPAASVAERAEKLTAAVKAAGHSVDTMLLPSVAGDSATTLQAMASLRMMDVDFFADALVLLDDCGAAISHRRKLFWIDAPWGKVDGQSVAADRPVEAAGRALCDDLLGEALGEAAKVFVTSAGAKAWLVDKGVKATVAAAPEPIVEAASR